MEKLEWHTQKRKVDDLLPYGENPRKMSDKQLEDLKKSLAKFNLVEIPAIDLDSRIIAGHQRIRALQLLGRGSELIEVRIPNRKLTEKEYEQYLLTSNAVTGSWDYELLKGFDLDLLVDIGFDQVELAHFWDRELEVKEEKFEVEKELRKIKDVQTKRGDLIILGNHKLICGDSTDQTVVERLFGTERASMLYSDPVYNINIDYGAGIGGKQNYGGNVNDRRTDAEYRELIRKSLEAALSVTHKDAHVFYWSDQAYIWLMQTLYRELGIVNKRVCLWIKNGHNPTPGVAFNKCYEPCTYGVRGKPYIAADFRNLTEVMNQDISSGNAMLEKIGDIWMAKRLSGKDYEHATSKPPELHEKAILRCTKPGDIILDSFSGSGSTLIAAEQLKRRVYAVELEPVFCDLTIRRFEKLTGLKAQIIHSDEKA
jgi:DNA modification methylase